MIPKITNQVVNNQQLQFDRPDSRPSPFPVPPATYFVLDRSWSRFLNMSLHGCSSICGGVYVNHEGYVTNPFNNSTSGSSCRLPEKFASLRVRSYWGPQQERRSISSSQAGTPFPYYSPSPSPFSSMEQGDSTHATFNLPRRHQPLAPPRALFFAGIFNFKYPPMTKKPRWWWRIVASFPYIMPLHETWMFASTAYTILTPLQDFEYLTYPFLRFLSRLPQWFLVGYFVFGYLGIVRRKEWPHFVRYNMCLGLLMEITLQIFGSTNQWMPEGLYCGKIGQYAWSMIVLNHFFSVLVCILCALRGIYADIPFFSHAAYLQIPSS